VPTDTDWRCYGSSTRTCCNPTPPTCLYMYMHVCIDVQDIVLEWLLLSVPPPVPTS
jgi:hypothetical protein